MALPIVQPILETIAEVAKIIQKKTLTASQVARRNWHEWRKGVLPRYLKEKASEKKDPGT